METPERTVMERMEQGTAPPPEAETPAACTFEVKNLSIWYGEKRAIDNDARCRIKRGNRHHWAKWLR